MSDSFQVGRLIAVGGGAHSGNSRFALGLAPPEGVVVEVAG